MQRHKFRYFLAHTLALIAFMLDPVFAFGDTRATRERGHGAGESNISRLGDSPYIFITVDIPTSSGQFGYTSLADISDNGEIVGGFTTVPQDFLLDKKFRPTEIQCPGAGETAALSINKHGEISGFCSSHGFFRNKRGQYTLLDFPAANLTEAAGLNNDGQVVGDYRDSDGKFHGFIWNAGSFLTIDVPFPDAVLTAPAGINSIGQIVGFYDDNGGARHGFLYDNGIFTSFDFPDAQLTDPADINDSGQIIGVYVDSDGALHGFLLEGERFTTVDVPLPAVILTDVRGINDRGEIVGQYLDTSFSSHGFIATPKSSSKLVAAR